MTIPARIHEGCPPRRGLQTRKPLRLLLAIPDLERSSCLSRRLQSLGHTILVEARDGTTTLDVSRQLRPHVILAAMELLGESGIAMARMATAEGIAPVVAILGLLAPGCVKGRVAPSQAEPGELEGTWGCVHICANEPILATAVQAAASLFTERRLLERARDTAEERLRHRQLVERAKGLVMTASGLSEQEAYRYLQKRSMDTGRPLWQIADAILLAGGLSHG